MNKRGKIEKQKPAEAQGAVNSAEAVIHKMPKYMPTQKQREVVAFIYNNFDELDIQLLWAFLTAIDNYQVARFEEDGGDPEYDYNGPSCKIQVPSSDGPVRLYIRTRLSGERVMEPSSVIVFNLNDAISELANYGFKIYSQEQFDLQFKFVKG